MTQDVHLEDGTVLRHIRNAKALGAIPFGALDNQMTWRRIHGNYYYINGFRGGSVIEDGFLRKKTIWIYARTLGKAPTNSSSPPAAA